MVSITIRLQHQILSIPILVRMLMWMNKLFPTIFSLLLLGKKEEPNEVVLHGTSEKSYKLTTIIAYQTQITQFPQKGNSGSCNFYILSLLCCFNIFLLEDSETESSAYMLDIAFWKYAFAWGLLICKYPKKEKNTGVSVSVHIYSKSCNWAIETCLKCWSEEIILHSERFNHQSHGFRKFKSS